VVILEACEERSVVCICFIKPVVKILVVKHVMRMIELLLACLMTGGEQNYLFFGVMNQVLLYLRVAVERQNKKYGVLANEN
jgi:hypothetical protein